MEEKCSVEKKKKTKLQMWTKIVILAIHQQKVAQMLANLLAVNLPRVAQTLAKIVQILQNQRIVPTATNFHPKKISQLRDFFTTLLLRFLCLDLFQHLF